MGGLRNWLHAVTPALLRQLYRQVKSMTRTAMQSLACRVVTCPVRGKMIKLVISSEIEEYRAATYESKEPETLDWLDRYIRPDDVFMDVGANIGLYSLFAAKLQPDCRIFAFEPESQNFSRLCMNLALNHVSNVVPCNFPLSDREVFDLFYVAKMEPGASLHSFGRPNDFLSGCSGTTLRQGAIAVTLDALVDKYGLPIPALLKIDVDGLEAEILAGAQHTLSSQVLRTVLIEVNFRDDMGCPAVEQALRGQGFSLQRKSGWVWEQNGMKSQNWIFARG